MAKKDREYSRAMVALNNLLRHSRFSQRSKIWSRLQEEVSGEIRVGGLIKWPDAFLLLTPQIVRSVIREFEVQDQWIIDISWWQKLKQLNIFKAISQKMRTVAMM